MRNMTRFLLIAVSFLVQSHAWAAKIGLNPLLGDGSPAWTVSISGASFEPSSTYAVTAGGYAVSPATVASNAAGSIPETRIFLPALPSGAHDVVLASATRTYTFTGAFRVRRNLCLFPASGYGKAGQTNAVNPSIPAGGWCGMVFQVEGSGFAASSTVAADSITVGGAATTHPKIITTYQGLLPTTTVMVGSDLAIGRKDVVINDGAATTFSGVYEVRRAIGLSPANGPRAAGTAIRIDGWGFADGTVGAILIGGVSTTHGAATIANGSFSVTVTLDSMVGNGANNVEFTGIETFSHVYHAVNSGESMAVSPVVFTGMPNEAFVLQGLGGWGNGAISQDSIKLYDGAVEVSGTYHEAITVANDVFPLTGVKAANPVSAATDRLRIYFPKANQTQSFLVTYVKRTVCPCPVFSNGSLGFTASLTGFGFAKGAVIAANSITIGGTAATHAAVTIVNATGAYGMFGPLLLYVPLLSNGDKDIVINDGTSSTFTGLFHARRSIGLSFVAGPGSSGEITSIIGRGFSPPSVSANSILFGAALVSHSAISVGGDGAFAFAPLTLPLLNAGAYDVTAQEAFTQAYRVYNPAVDISKHRTPPAAVSAQVVTYSFSYTNVGYVGDPPVKSFVLHDTIPGGMEYLAGTATSYERSLVEWYNGAAWVTVEPAPASVQRIRWTLAAPLASGASGLASFQVTVQ